MRLAPALLVALLCQPALAGEIEVLHWWTAGGEARAADVMRQHWQALGHRWVDAAIVGGGGNSAMMVLRSRALNHTPPQAAHLKGVELHEWAERGFLRNLDDIARRGQWQLRLYPFVSSTLNHQGHFMAIPVGLHRVNWLWINQSLFSRLQLTPPRNWEEMVVVARRLKQAGITPLAMGDDPWQLAILFEAIALGEGGSDFFRRAFVNLEPEVLAGAQMQQVLRRFHSLRPFLPANHIGLKWNQATHMLVEGQAAMQLMGDWVKGELHAPGEPMDPAIRCLPAPGTAGKFSYNLDSLALFQQRDSERDKDQVQFAELLMSTEFQQEFNQAKGSIPPLADADLSQFDSCGLESAKALQYANQHGDLVPSMAEGMAIPTNVQQAIFDLLASYFSDPQGDATLTARQLARAVRAVSAEQ
jgi:glucose/mannose transport system substrate-binding protein